MPIDARYTGVTLFRKVNWDYEETSCFIVVYRAREKGLDPTFFNQNLMKTSFSLMTDKIWDIIERLCPVFLFRWGQREPIRNSPDIFNIIMAKRGLT